MVDKLMFSDMTWEILEDKHGIQVDDKQALFAACPPVEPSAVLRENIKRGLRSRLVNERARSTRLVDPVLGELEALRPEKIATLQEASLEAKGMEGLCGNPDFLITAGSSTKLTPIIAILEAKRDNIDAGLAQCAAALYAAYLLNQGRLSQVFGCVTTGTDWRFLSFHGETKRVVLDSDLYFIVEPARLLGVLCYMVDTCLAALEITAQAAH